jgi:hypothetical protein
MVLRRRRAVFVAFVAWNRGLIMSTSPAVLDDMLTGRFPCTPETPSSLVSSFTVLLPVIVVRVPETVRQLFATAGSG